MPRNSLHCVHREVAARVNDESLWLWLRADSNGYRVRMVVQWSDEHIGCEDIAEE
jgi:hypothetical protein